MQEVFTISSSTDEEEISVTQPVYHRQNFEYNIDDTLDRVYTLSSQINSFLADWRSKTSIDQVHRANDENIDIPATDAPKSRRTIDPNSPLVKRLHVVKRPSSSSIKKVTLKADSLPHVVLWHSLSERFVETMKLITNELPSIQTLDPIIAKDFISWAFLDESPAISLPRTRHILHIVAFEELIEQNLQSLQTIQYKPSLCPLLHSLNDAIVKYQKLIYLESDVPYHRTLVLYGTKRCIGNRQTRINREFQKMIKEDNTSSSIQRRNLLDSDISMKWPETERMMYLDALSIGLHIEYIESEEDLSKYILEATRGVAWEPFKRQKEDHQMENLSFCGHVGVGKKVSLTKKNSCPSSNSSSNDSTTSLAESSTSCIDENVVSKIFKHALECIPGITDRVSGTVLKTYPTINSLIGAYNKCVSTQEREGLLADLRIDTTRIGPAISRKIYRTLYLNTPESPIL